MTNSNSNNTFNLEIRRSSGTAPQLLTVLHGAASTIAQVKALLTNPTCKLMYKGRILEDSKTLQDYGICHGATLFQIGGAKTSLIDTQASTTAAADKASDLDTKPSSTNNRTNRESTTPLWQQQVLNDPAMMRQALELMRNPDAMQQAMRQQDLALAQLEHMPGGFHALQNMYESVQQMEDSIQMPGDNAVATSQSRNTTTSTTINEGAQGTAMPNPWGTSTARNLNTTTRRVRAPLRGTALQQQRPAPSIFSRGLVVPSTAPQPASTSPISTILPNPWSSRPPPATTSTNTTANSAQAAAVMLNPWATTPPPTTATTNPSTDNSARTDTAATDTPATTEEKNDDDDDMYE
jgi:hypothetical protein